MPTDVEREPVCVATGVAKRFGGVQALAGVDIAIHPGQIHALVGENGAGKSTLMKILAGAETADTGDIHINGEPVQLTDVQTANEHGIAIVFQELSVYPDLDVLANLFLRREPRRLGFVQRRRMAEQAADVLAQLGIEVDLRVPVGQLRLADQQLLEIAKALLLDARVLILDEPNSALNAAETERLFDVLRTLRARGTAIVYVSHRLEEVFEISDLITVLRNGKHVLTSPIEQMTIPAVVRAMIGRDPSKLFVRERIAVEEVDVGCLRVEGLEVRGAVRDVELVARPGEVIGLAGLVGSGAEAVLDAVFGRRPHAAGRIVLPNGQPLGHGMVRAVRSGVALVPADRREEGLSLQADVPSNMAQVNVGALGRGSAIVRRDRLEKLARKHTQRLGIRIGNLGAPVNQLSGGNQQKVVIAKWLEMDPTVVLLNDPTRGVDIGAKAEIYQIVDDLARHGRILLFTSSELPEYLQLCDRIALFYRGRMVGTMNGDSLTAHDLLEAINTGSIAA